MLCVIMAKLKICYWIAEENYLFTFCTETTDWENGGGAILNYIIVNKCVCMYCIIQSWPECRCETNTVDSGEEKHSTVLRTFWTFVTFQANWSFLINEAALDCVVTTFDTATLAIMVLGTSISLTHTYCSPHVLATNYWLYTHYPGP